MSDLFEKVKQEVEKGISAVNLKSREVVSSIKISMDIEALERQIISAYNKLGETVYTMSTQQIFNEERLREECGEISILKEELAEKEKELNQVRNETNDALKKAYSTKDPAEPADKTGHCPHCGSKLG